MARSRWWVTLLVVGSACHRPPAQAEVTEAAATAVAASAASSVPSSAPSPSDAATTSSEAALVERWNTAHADHDAAALAALYADTVYFYGKNLPRAECVKRKSAAFAKSPDYTQVVKDLSIHARGDRWVAELTKSWTAGGRTTDSPAVLYVDAHGHISAEMDRPGASWCTSADGELNGVVIPPFTIGASAAKAHLMRSRYRKELAGDAAFVVLYQCPDVAACPSGVARATEPRTDAEQACYFNLRMGARLAGSDPGRPPLLGGPANHMWFDMGTWTDGVTDAFWYQSSPSDIQNGTWHRDPER